ncbi:ankyrin repeat domain-containing protein 34A [Caloenas nicobarica]|uniref:ankyrin repeat domain-containing protein 34A n=1 Tax=Caloenas nicobarica TaxID=187106 RepID=UPI0032B84203
MPSPVRRPPGATGPPGAAATLPADGSALLRAVAQGKFRLTRLLLEGGAYINEGNAAGHTPLMAACGADYADPPEQPRMVRYLLENGADPNIPDKTGKTALMHACAQGAGPGVAAVLLAHGADPSARDYAGASALVYAVERGERETLRVLLDACKARGKEVIIITTDTSPSGTKTTRQYLNSPPSPGLEGKRSPGVCMSPSDIEVRAAASPAGSEKEEERDIFCFPPPPPVTAVPDLPRGARGRPLKRLNSEPWGLVASGTPEGTRGPTAERLVPGMEGLSLGGRPRRHSVEGREAAGLPGAAWAERVPPACPQPLPRRNTAPETPWGGKPRRDPSENEGHPQSGESSPPGTRRRPPGLLERRGSGTLLLEPWAPGRFLPPLPPPRAPPPGPPSPKGRRKLLRRHSMQPEELRLLVNFQSGLAPEPGT